MSPIASRYEAAEVSLRQLYAPIAKELEAVEEILRRELRSQHAYVDELVRYGCLLGGKRCAPCCCC